MTITRTLALVIAVVLGLYIFFGVLLFRQQANLNFSLQRNQMLSQQIHDEVHLQVLMDNYILSLDERFVYRYLGMLKGLREDLRHAGALFHNPDRRQATSEMLETVGALEQLAERIWNERVETRLLPQERVAPEVDNLAERFSDGTIAELLVRYQSLIGATLRLLKLDEQETNRMAQRNLRWIVLALVTSFLIIAGLFVALIFRVRHDFGRLAEGVRQLGEGDLSVRLDIRRHDEIGRLGAIFNQMINRLEQGEVQQFQIMESLSLEQQRVSQKAQQEEVLSQLGQIALKRLSMSDYLDEMLEALLRSVSWLQLQTKGAVFLRHDEDEEPVLNMVASLNMDPELRARCAQVALGECLCGRAANERCMVYAARVDARHEIWTTRLHPHGHYCLPILQQDHLLGVLTLYLPEGHAYSDEEVQFLKQVSDVFGLGIIQRQSEQHIEFQAYHDALTGLPNRRLLQERMERELAMARRHGQMGALVFFDLDNFKVLNDSLGHNTGDELLVQVADRLRETVRDEDMLARVGGDEFLVVLSSLSSRVEGAELRASRVADKLKEIITRPYHLNGHQFHLTASFGITLFPDRNVSGEELFRRADTAMYKAKEEGRNGIALFSGDMQEEADRRLLLEQDMRFAIEQGEFEPWFQPKFNASNNVIGAEVLLRWQHQGQSVSPGEFIPIAEESGLIIDLGQWLLDDLCRRLPRWREQIPSATPAHIAVNISPNQFYQPAFVNTIQSVIEVFESTSTQLVLEVTEGVLLQKSDRVIETMQQLKTFGVRLSIDDFGTGYSSLAYLKRLALDEIKIDRSFVDGVHEDEDNRLIVDTILAMARHFQLDVVAEGVETREELDFLKGRGCCAFQGFYFSRPLPEEAFIRLLRDKAQTDPAVV